MEHSILYQTTADYTDLWLLHLHSHGRIHTARKMLNQHDKILKWGQEVQNNSAEAGLVVEELQVRFMTIINKEVRLSSGLFNNHSE